MIRKRKNNWQQYEEEKETETKPLIWKESAENTLITPGVFQNDVKFPTGLSINEQTLEKVSTETMVSQMIGQWKKNPIGHNQETTETEPVISTEPAENVSLTPGALQHNVDFTTGLSKVQQSSKKMYMETMISKLLGKWKKKFIKDNRDEEAETKPLLPNEPAENSTFTNGSNGSKKYRQLSRGKSDAQKHQLEVVSLGTILAALGLTLFSFIFYRLVGTMRETNDTDAFLISAVVAAVLSVGITISFDFREIIYLFLLTFMTARGRATLVSILLVATADGPFFNIRHNLKESNNFLVCHLNKTLGSENALIRLIVGRSDLVQTFEKLMKTYKEIIRDAEKTFQQITQGFRDLNAFFQKYGRFVESLTSGCRDKVIERLFKECVIEMEKLKSKCNKKLWGLLKITQTCRLTSLAKNTICPIVKTLKIVCYLPKVMANAVTKILKSSVTQFKKWACPVVHKIFFFEVTVKSENYFKSSLDMEVDELYEQVEKVVFEEGGVIQWSVRILKWFTIFQVVWSLYNSRRYRNKYIKIDYYDNYILEVPEFEIIDQQRKRLGADTVLPLSFIEKQKYIYRKNWRCSWSEMKACGVESLKTVIVSVLVNSVILVDHKMYALLNQLQQDVAIGDKSILNEKAFVVKVEGSGFLSKLYAETAELFMSSSSVMDIVRGNICEPAYLAPDPQFVYFAIMMQIFLLFSTCLNSYGMRMRSAICNSFHPDRRQKRSLWLVNHILIMRTCTILPRLTRKKLKGAGAEKRKVSWWEIFLEKNPLMGKLVKSCFGIGVVTIRCELCGTTGRPEDLGKKFSDCLNTSCRTIYCIYCANEMSGMCFVCNSHLFEANEQNVELAKDSSDDEEMWRNLRKIQMLENQTETELQQFEQLDFVVEPFPWPILEPNPELFEYPFEETFPRPIPEPNPEQFEGPSVKLTAESNSEKL